MENQCSIYFIRHHNKHHQLCRLDARLLDKVPLQMDQWQEVGAVQCARSHADTTQSVGGDAGAHDE